MFDACVKQHTFTHPSLFPVFSVSEKTSSLPSKQEPLYFIDSGTPQVKVTLVADCPRYSSCAFWERMDAVPEELLTAWESALSFSKQGEFSKDAGKVPGFSLALQLTLQSLSFVKTEVKSLGLYRGNLFACWAQDAVTGSLSHTWLRSSGSQDGDSIVIFFESKRQNNLCYLLCM